MIWLIGCNGMLGTELVHLFEKTGIAYIGTDRDIDITNKVAIEAFARGKSIDWIVNCAAYTAVDNAENDIEVCRALNTDGPEIIAAIAFDIGAKLIHISTDYVFNGKGNRPYTEEDTTDPIGVYGLTKRDGENRILALHRSSYIIRSAWLYGKYGKNFVATMLRLMAEQISVSVVNDQTGSPTYAFDLANALIAIIQKVDNGASVPYGIYNFTDEGSCTWFEFAKTIYDVGRKTGLLTKNCTVNPCTSAEFPAKVKRPHYSVLDKTKIQKVLDYPIPVWEASLKLFLQERKVDLCVH